MNEYMADRCDRIANSCYNAGLQRARERELSAAVPFLKRALLFNKRHTDARNLLGLIFYEIGEVGDALAQWVISTSLDPEGNAAVRYLDEIRRKRGRLKAYSQMITMYNTALAAAQNGNRDFAMHRLSGVCSEHPNYVRAALLLALIHMSRGEFGRAEYYLNRVLRVDRSNPDAVRYLAVVKKNRKERPEETAQEGGKNAYSHRQMTDDDVIIPPTYRESTGWQTIVNIGMGLLIGAAAVLFLYMPTKTAELTQLHNHDLMAVSEKLSKANNEIQSLTKENRSLTEARDALDSELNTVDESYTYKLSQFQKMIGILNDYRTDNYSHAADLYATIDVSQLTDIEDGSGISVSEIYTIIAERMNAEGYLSLYAMGERAYEQGNYEDAIAYYDKSLAINPEYQYALFRKAMSYKKLGDIQNANNLFGEVIMRFPDTELAREAQLERGY